MWLTKASAKVQDQAVRALSFTLALLIALAAIVSGVSGSVEVDLRDARDHLRKAPASGEIVILEIDGRSIQALEQWPWPRSHYADAILELDRLGAAQIAFDVDFSSRSNPAEDAQVAKALAAREGNVILPTFRQENLAGGDQDVTEALPLPEFQEHSFLASVNVFPSADGRIDRYSFGVSTNGVSRPSLASMLAAKAGRINEFFRIDQAIDPATIDRISFVDLLEGRVTRNQVNGKRILVGATAIELGDRYPTALFGVKPGVVIQAQAAETLIQDRARSDSGPWLPLAVMAILLLALAWVRTKRLKMIQIGAGIAAIAIVVSLALDQIAGPYIQLTSAGILLGTFLSIDRIAASARALQRARLTDGASELPNRRAMSAVRAKLTDPVIAVAKIDDFEQMEAIVASTDLPRLERKIAVRLGLLAGSEPVYRIDRAVFAWFVPPEQVDDLESHFTTARAVFNSPVELDEKRLKIKAYYGSSANSITKAASAAEYARRQSINWSSTAIALEDEAQFQQKVLGELDDALKSGAMHVLFQPKLRLSDQSIYGAECLVRWNSPTLGSISPADFIPILEAKDQVSELTIFVLGQALERSREAHRIGQPVQLAVNVSAQLLSDAEFINTATKMLTEAQIKGAEGITLEVTESAPLDDPELAKRALGQLCDAGARISIDDYGTGQATLNYLQGFPAEEIKLDQSFVRNLIENRADRIMVQSTIDLAHALSFEIVAEGVEDQATLDALDGFGCDFAQGWQIGKPMEWHSFIGRVGLEKRSKASAAA